MSFIQSYVRFRLGLSLHVHAYEVLHKMQYFIRTVWVQTINDDIKFFLTLEQKLSIHAQKATQNIMHIQSQRACGKQIDIKVVDT